MIVWHKTTQYYIPGPTYPQRHITPPGRKSSYCTPRWSRGPARAGGPPVSRLRHLLVAVVGAEEQALVSNPNESLKYIITSVGKSEVLTRLGVETEFNEVRSSIAVAAS